MPALFRMFRLLLLAGLFSVPGLSLAGPADDAARALHLLGYVGADYPETVAAGEVVDTEEYAEQLEFIGVLQALVAGLPAHAERVQLEQGVQQLLAAIERRAPGETVARQARALAAQLAETYQVVQLPLKVPAPERGRPLYAQHCAACHGALGAGDGPGAVGLNPAPADLRNQARIDRMSLYDLFNTLGLGVQGTAMPGYAELLDGQQRWDLASFIAGFSVGSGPGSSAGISADGNSAGVLFDLPTLTTATPAEIAARGGDVAAFRAQRAHPPRHEAGVRQHIDTTRELLQRSLTVYREGDHQQAYDLSIAAYLEGFERLENALDNLDSQQRKATERALMAYRQALQDDAGPEVAQGLLRQALAELETDAQLLAGDAVDASLSFFTSLLILLREGLEAILVLAAILAYLHKTGQQQARRSVHLGWGAAVLVGFATWALAAYVIEVSGAQRELLEGLTALFASAVLLWVGVWMHNRRQAASWQDYVRDGLGRAGGRFGFALLAFFAVYRELFEVILFYQTLWLQAGPAGHGMVLAGAAVALVLLVGLAWVILRGARTLPLGIFFGANAVLLCVLAVVFAGQGVAALQEAGALASRPLAFFEFDWLGIYPDAWSLSVQGLVLLAIALVYLRGWRSAPTKVSAL